MPADGNLYRSDDRGKTWIQKPAFPTAKVSANSAPPKAYGRFMAVDPQNPDVLYVGTPNQGLFVTANGGASFTAVSAVGTASGPGAGGNIIAFDPSSSVSDGKKQGIFVSTYGVGVYHSTNGGSSWSLLNTTGMPTTHMHLIVDQNGKVWMTTTTGRANVVNWTTRDGWVVNSIPADYGSFASVATDPSNSNNVVALGQQGFLYLSTDGGHTWRTNQSFHTHISGDQTWTTVSNSSAPSLSSADIQYDASQPGTAYITTGTGIMYFNPTVGGNSSVSYTSQVTGIEEVVAGAILAPPGGLDVIGGSEDFPVWHWASSDLDKNRSAALPAYLGLVPRPFELLVTGMMFDYAPSNPKFIIGAIGGNGLQGFGSDHSGYSTDGGATWTEFQTKPAQVGAGENIAAASETNFVWATAYGGSNVYYTTNGGRNWLQSAGLRNITFSGIFFLPWYRYLAADKVNTGTFYLYVPSGNTGNDGIWRSTNGGVSFTRVHPGSLDATRDGGEKCFKVNPYVAGDLWFTAGYQQGSNHPATMNLYRSIDGGMTWHTVAGFQETFCFGFGAIVPGQTYPVICVVGWRSGVYGFWESRDNGSTWASLGDYPNGWFRNPTDIDGDKSVLGKWYVPINGSGFRYYTP
jgi:photosystem II stability/assembly factor-like uncharacterized protein